MLTNYEKRNPHKFWKWFSHHEKEFLNINDSNYLQLFFKISSYLEKYNPYLGFEIALESVGNHKKELMFTANGNKYLFPSVYALVNAAPAHLKERWNFTALRQPNIEEIIIHIDDLTISSKDIFYEIAKSISQPGMWDIFIYIKGIQYDSEELENYIAHTMVSLLDGIVGEYKNTLFLNELILVDQGDLENPKKILQLRKELKDLDTDL